MEPVTPACSLGSLAAGEPLAGSAPHAPLWLCLEQAGPWGAKAFTQSHLDPELGAEIERTTAAHGVRPALIRRPGRHADDHSAPRTLMLATTDPSGPRLAIGQVDDPTEVLDLDWSALAAGDVAAAHPRLTLTDDHHLLVCTNGSRDTCCARFGRPVVAAAAATRPGRVWEVTHTSGHRFAPTTVLLPSGHLHGRVEDGPALLDHADEGRLLLAGWRGRSTWPTAGQAAEAAVREAEGVDGLDQLGVVRDGEGWRVVHTDGRAWTVEVSVEQTEALRSESCGKPAVPVSRFHTRVSAAPSIN